MKRNIGDRLTPKNVLLGYKARMNVIERKDSKHEENIDLSLHELTIENISMRQDGSR